MDNWKCCSYTSLSVQDKAAFATSLELPSGNHLISPHGNALPDVQALYLCSGVTWPSGIHHLKKAG